jgi:hypothetical protein
MTAVFDDENSAVYPVRLRKPEGLSVNNGVLTWTAVENAIGYSVDISGEKFTTDTNEYSLESLTTPGSYNVSIKAVGNGVGYTDSEWSSTEIYNVADAPCGNPDCECKSRGDGVCGCGEDTVEYETPEWDFADLDSILRAIEVGKNVTMFLGVFTDAEAYRNGERAQMTATVVWANDTIASYSGEIVPSKIVSGNDCSYYSYDYDKNRGKWSKSETDDKYTDVILSYCRSFFNSQGYDYDAEINIYRAKPEFTAALWGENADGASITIMHDNGEIMVVVSVDAYCMVYSFKYIGATTAELLPDKFTDNTRPLVPDFNYTDEFSTDTLYRFKGKTTFEFEPERRGYYKLYCRLDLDYGTRLPSAYVYDADYRMILDGGGIDLYGKTASVFLEAGQTYYLLMAANDRYEGHEEYCVVVLEYTGETAEVPTAPDFEHTKGMSPGVRYEIKGKTTFMFNPTESGFYQFYSYGRFPSDYGSDPYIVLYGEDYAAISVGNPYQYEDFSVYGWLEAGQTYYILATSVTWDYWGAGYYFKAELLEEQNDPAVLSAFLENFGYVNISVELYMKGDFAVERFNAGNVYFGYRLDYFEGAYTELVFNGEIQPESGYILGDGSGNYFHYRYSEESDVWVRMPITLTEIRIDGDETTIIEGSYPYSFQFFDDMIYALLALTPDADYLSYRLSDDG